MQGKRTRPRRKYFYIFTVGGCQCVDAGVGRLFDKFTLGATTADEEGKFREHLVDCLYCAALVTNFKHTREASERYGVPVGPELDQYLDEVPLRPITEKLRRVSGEVLRKFSPKKPKGEHIH